LRFERFAGYLFSRQSTKTFDSRKRAQGPDLSSQYFPVHVFLTRDSVGDSPRAVNYSRPIDDNITYMQKLFTPELTERQTVAARLLAKGVAQEKLAHALLLTGRAHEDKWLIARQLTAFLNCSKEDKLTAGACLLKWQEACVEEDGTAATDLSAPVLSDLALACQNCRWLFQDQHPKAWIVLSADAGKSGKIPVESARLLSEELGKTSNYFRVVVVEEAKEAAFHRPAANALLKTIEEPKSPSLFLLFSQTADDVLTTIVSRCQVVPLNNRIADNVGPIARLAIGNHGVPGSAGNLKTQEINRELATKLSEMPFLQKNKSNARHALNLASSLQQLLDDEYDPEQIVDALVSHEIKAITTANLTDARSTAYLAKLLKISEDAKRQIDQYVSKKAVCESFVLTWHDLRQNFNSRWI